MSQGGVAKPDRGPKKKISQQVEKDMACYLNDCWELGIPKTRQRFALDVANYLDCYRIPNLFCNKVPGIL